MYKEVVKGRKLYDFDIVLVFDCFEKFIFRKK